MNSDNRIDAHYDAIMKTMLKGYEAKDYSLKDVLDLVKPGSYVLSAGCGAGREVAYLVRTLKCKVVAIDIDEEAVELSKDKTPDAEHIVGDMTNMKFKKKFDYIVCLWNTINYLKREDRKIFIETCYDNLKEGGELILTTTHIFTHWRLLLSNIKHGKNFHPYPWEIDQWFKDTKFRITKGKMNNDILIRARK